MAYDVEDKVVQMRFDNRDFDPNIDASIKSLEKLEAALKFEKAKDGINDLQKTVNKFSLSNFAKEFKTGLIDGLTQFETVGRTILYRFTDSAITELNKLKNAFIIAPLSSGWGEYSEQMNSTQVIMSNTGDSLAKITKNLDELNEYADRTIYSFGQMTTAIGKFAAAGVELTDATKAIKGLSSAAATVGASNQQLFSAYYNLAQSLQLGYVQLIDWKSLENSTIGNKTMREAFIKTAIEMGKFTEASEQAQKAYSDFRGSLSSKWLTTDVVLTTLQKYSRAIKEVDGAYYDFDENTRQTTDALTEIKDASGEIIGYYSQMYGELSKWEVELGVTAYKSATEIKSFQQMWDTLTEAAGTGWAETWKVIFGDLEQAKDLWTDVSNSIESVITAFTNLRNEALKGWKSWGGYEDLKETIKSLARIFENLGKTVALTMSILTGSTTGFEEDLNKDADSAGKSLALITKRLRIFVTSIEKGTEKIQEHARALAKVLTPLKWVAKALGFVVKLTLTIIVIGDALIKTLINIIMNLKDFPELIKQIFGESAWNRFATVLNIILTLGKLLCSVLYLMFSAVEGVVNLFIGFEKQTGILGKVMTGLATVIFTVSDALITGVNALSDWLFKLSEIIRIGPDFKKIFNDVASFLGGSFVQGIVEGFKKGSSTIVDGVKTIGTSIITTLENTLEINSPSKKGIAIGGFFIAGIVAGILGALSLVSKTSSKIGETAVNSTKKSMSFKGTNSKKSNIGGRISAMATNIKNSLGQATKSLDNINGSANEADKKTNNILENVKTHLENIGDGISEFYKNTLKPMIMNLNTGKVLAIGFSVAIIAFIFAIGSFFDKFGNMFTSLGQAAINFVQSIGRMADGVVDNLKAMAAETRSKAFEHISDSIFTIAKALALLTLVAAWNPDGLKQAAIMLGIFAGSIGLLVAAFTILYNKIQQLQTIGDAKKAMQHFAEMGKTMARMVSMSAMILAITIAMATMTKSIATLSEMPIKDALKGLAIVELLMASLVGVVFVLSKFTPQLTRGTLLMFAFAYAVKLFSSAMASIGGNLEDGIQRLTNMSVGTYVKLILLISVLTVFSTFVGKASTTITKVVMSLTMLSIGLGLMAFMISKINADSEVVSSLLEYLTSGKALTALIFLIGALTASIILISKFAPKIYTAGSAMKQMAEPLSRLALSLSAIIVSLAAVIGVIAFAKGNLSNDDFNSVMASFAVIMVSLATFIGGIIAALYGIGTKAKKSKLNSGIFENFNKVLGSIALVITALTLNLLIIVGAMSMFWNKYGFDIEGGWMVLGSAIAMLAALSIIIAGLIAVVGSTYKANGVGALKLLIPTIFMIGELIGAVAILAAISHDTDAYWMALAGIAGIMRGLALVIAAIGTLQHDSKTELASGSKSEKSFNNTFKIIVTIVAGIAAIIGEIGALTIILGNSGNYDAFSAAIGMYGIVMTSMALFIALLAHYSKQLSTVNDGLFKNLVVIMTGVILLITAMAGVMYIIASNNLSWSTVLAAFGGIALAMSAILAGMSLIIHEYNSQYYDAGTLMYMVAMLGTLTTMVAAFGLFVKLLGKQSWLDVLMKVVALSAGVAAMTTLLIVLSKLTGVNADFKKILPIFATLTGVMGAIAGMMRILKGIEIGNFVIEITLLSAAMWSLFGLSDILAKASNQKINKANIGIMIASMAALASIIPVFSASIAMLQSINIDQIGEMAASMGIMVGMFALLAGVFVGFSYAIQKIPVPYIGLAIAVLSGITVAMLAFAGAIMVLNSVSLEQLVDNLAALFNVGWQMAGVGMAFIALGLGMAVLGAGLTPVAVALLIVAGAIFIFATAAKILIDSFEKSSQTLKDFTEAINNVDFEAVERLFNLLNKLSIISMASFPGLAAMAAFIKQLTNMISALPAITEVIVPFTESLADAGKIISDNQASITALADNIKKLGIAILIAAPAVIMLAYAFGIVVTSIGLALLLAAPFALSLGLALTALAAVILHMKDAAIALFNAVMNRLPEIAAVVESMKDSADIMISVGQGLASFGFGLMMLGLGGVVGALGLLALCGAMKVLEITIKSIFGETADLTEKFNELYNNGGAIAALGAAFLALGLGLLVLGAGSLVGGIGLLALSGALAVLNIVLTNIIGPANNLEEAFLRIWANGGRIAALGAAFVALGIGLIAVGAGSLVAGVGFLALAVGLISLAIPTVIIVAALSLFVLVITNLVNSITGCINAITMFTMALVILANTGNLIVTGIGLFLVAGGFAAVGAASMLLVPIIPIILLVVQVMTQVTGILYIVGDAIEYFTSKLETSSVSIGNSMMNIANSFVSAISVIKEGIASIGNLGSTASNAANNVVKGFCGGILEKLPFFKKSTNKAAEASQEGFTEPLKIASPSEWFAWAGRMCSSGFDEGIAGEMPKFFGSGEDAGEGVISGFVDGLKEKAKSSKVGKVISSVVDVATGKASLGDIADKYIGKDTPLGKVVDTVKGIWSGDGLDLSKALGMDTSAFEDAASGAGDYTSALGDAGSAAGSTKGTIESLTDTLKNQMKIFERFTADEEMIKPAELINNMKSQLRGMQNWANGIDMLAVRGMSGPLLQYLAEMGPEGYKYVEAFLEMTEDEFAQANDLYAQSLEMPSNTANQIADSYRLAGVEIVEAVASGISSGSGAVNTAMNDIDDTITDSTKKTMDSSETIAIDGVNHTQGEIADLVAKYGPDAALVYIKELDAWMDESSPEWAKYVASVQGKVGNIFRINTNELLSMLGNNNGSKTAVIKAVSGYWTEVQKEAMKNSDAQFIVDGLGKMDAARYIHECERIGKKIGATVIGATEKELGIASPSKKYEEVGMYSIEGFAKGIEKYSTIAEDASKDVGEGSLSSLANTLQAISSQFTDDMDTTPTIRPVLDLDNVYTGMAELDTMFSTNQARIAGSAYMTTHDDSVERLEEAYRKAIMDGNLELANMLLNSEDTNVVVDVHLDANAEGIFDLVKVENEKATKRTGASPLMIARRNAMQASLVH